MNISELVKKTHQNAVEHGWWDEELSFGEQIALMHSELSEALEEFRNDLKLDEIYQSCQSDLSCPSEETKCQTCENFAPKPEGIPIELADCIIRIFDTCGRYGIDLEKAIQIKMEYNKTRPYRHGGKKI